MSKANFMETVTLLADQIRNDFRSASDVVKQISKLPKKDAMLVTAYISDQLHGEENYRYFLSAFARLT